MLCLPQLGDYQIGFAENDKITNWVSEAWTSHPLTDHPRRTEFVTNSSKAGWGGNKPYSTNSAPLLLLLLIWDGPTPSTALIKTQCMQIQVECSFWNWLQIERVNNNYKKKTKLHFTRTRIYSCIGDSSLVLNPNSWLCSPHWHGKCKWILFIRCGCSGVWVPVMLAQQHLELCIKGKWFFNSTTKLPQLPCNLFRISHLIKLLHFTQLSKSRRWQEETRSSSLDILTVNLQCMSSCVTWFSAAQSECVLRMEASLFGVGVCIISFVVAVCGGGGGGMVNGS